MAENKPQLIESDQIKSAIIGPNRGIIDSALQNNGWQDTKAWISGIINALEKAPELKECTISSWRAAILNASQVGFVPNTNEQFCFLIPRQVKGTKVVSFEMGYQGIQQLMLEMPDIENVEAEIVHEKDEFDYELGSNKYIKHRPHRGRDRGKRTACYCIVTYTNGKQHFEVLERDEIEELKQNKISGANSKYSPWYEDENNKFPNDPFGWMWRKTAIKQASKMVKKTNRLTEAIQADDKAETGTVMEVDETGDVKESNPEQAQEKVESKANKASDHAKNVVSSKNEQIQQEHQVETSEGKDQPKQSGDSQKTIYDQ